MHCPRHRDHNGQAPPSPERHRSLQPALRALLLGGIRSRSRPHARPDRTDPRDVQAFRDRSGRAGAAPADPGRRRAHHPQGSRADHRPGGPHGVRGPAGDQRGDHHRGAGALAGRGRAARGAGQPGRRDRGHPRQDPGPARLGPQHARDRGHEAGGPAPGAQLRAAAGRELRRGPCPAGSGGAPERRGREVRASGGRGPGGAAGGGHRRRLLVHVPADRGARPGHELWPVAAVLRSPGPPAAQADARAGPVARTGHRSVQLQRDGAGRGERRFRRHFLLPDPGEPGQHLPRRSGCRVAQPPDPSRHPGKNRQGRLRWLLGLRRLSGRLPGGDLRQERDPSTSPTTAATSKIPRPPTCCPGAASCGGWPRQRRSPRCSFRGPTPPFPLPFP